MGVEVRFVDVNTVVGEIVEVRFQFDKPIDFESESSFFLRVAHGTGFGGSAEFSGNVRPEMNGVSHVGS
jgi:hypothetical protein